MASNPIQTGDSSRKTASPTGFFDLPAELQAHILEDALTPDQPLLGPHGFLDAVPHWHYTGPGFYEPPEPKSQIEVLSTTVMSLLAIVRPDHWASVALALKKTLLTELSELLMQWDLKDSMDDEWWTHNLSKKAMVRLRNNGSSEYPSHYEDLLRSFARATGHLLRYTKIISELDFKNLMQRAERPDRVIKMDDYSFWEIDLWKVLADTGEADALVVRGFLNRQMPDAWETRTVFTSGSHRDLRRPGATILVDFERAMLMLDYQPGRKVSLRGVQYIRDIQHETSISYLWDNRIRRHSLWVEYGKTLSIRGW